MEKLLDTNEVADILNVCNRTVRNYINQGYLPAIKFKKEWRVREDNLKRFLARKEIIK